MKLSVVILSYKVPHHLMLCLDSVTKAIEHIDAEIIVVDNNSEDESCDLVKQNFPKVNLVKNTENSGFSKGNNKGAEEAKGEYLCILNPDTVVPEDCFSELLNYHMELENTGAIGVQLIDGSGEFLQESKRNVPTPRVALKKLLGKPSSYYNFDLNKNENGPTAILVGAFIFLKTDVYLSIGGFDEDYFMYGEDIDFSFRIIKAGFQNYYFGKSQVLHFKGESTTKDQVYLQHFFNAMSIFYKKHFKTYGTSFRLIRQSLNIRRFIEKLKLKSAKIQSPEFKDVYLISEDTDLLAHLKAKLNSNVNLMSKIDSELKDALIVMDANHIRYKDCIEIITGLKSKTNVFRIKPRNYNFIIGSDSKYIKGEVIGLS
ncbi:glycosyltransferase family 2 protein [Psychroflexus sp. CAK57W]|uniref:glycosyltransferase family 2 protein n=1 Tax=Psychroflexus curvus TaxID=2873595 RepID=UPI001CCBFFC6|nr:glycosyltransferase family 2 protein [Psychroflexus curvus]MBZ9785925.1 glycosyltransferase family 2 protein [Psychroflexus curvus]